MSEKPRSLLRTEASFVLTGATALVFATAASSWLADLSNPLWLCFVLAWLLGVIVVSIFAVVRHAEALAVLLGEPYGTLILTLSVISIEVMVIASVMLTGEENPELARDTMYGVMMIMLNGAVGSALLIGGLKHHEQEYNLGGANAFLSVITPLAIIGLVLPSYTLSTQGPTFSEIQEIFMIVVCLGLYGVLLGVQTVRHQHYFVGPNHAESREAGEAAEHGLLLRKPLLHGAMLVLHLIPVVVLAETMGVPLNHTIEILGAPPPLGGFFIALVVLLPEVVGALRASHANDVQRSINITLGSAAATIGLTIPAVLGVGFYVGHQVVLGLGAVDQVMLLLTLLLCVITFGSGRTNILQGFVHLVIFFAYLVLIFD